MAGKKVVASTRPRVPEAMGEAMGVGAAVETMVVVVVPQVVEAPAVAMVIERAAAGWVAADWVVAAMAEVGVATVAALKVEVD